MRLSLKSKVFLNSYLAIALAFFFPLAAATSAFGTQTPAQQISQLNSDLTYYTQQYSAYTGHYQQYAPSRMSELNQFASSLTTFSSNVATAQAALTTSNQATQDLATAQSNVAAVPGLISTSQQALTTAQANYDAASTSLQALTPSYSQALQERNDAWSAYQATVVNQSVLEQFTNNQVSTGIQVLVGGTDPISTTGNPRLTSGFIFIDQYGPGLEFKPPTGSTPTSLGFKTYARNGDQQVTVTFNDDSTAQFTQPNGVGNPNCPDYWCTISYTAPEGKTIKSFFVPGDWDILYIDDVSFTANSYNQTAYDNYLAKQAALDAIAPSYNSAVSALSTATSALQSAQATYNTYSDPSYLTNLEAIRDTKDAEASAAYSALLTAINDATVARTATVDAYNAITLPPTSLEVTSTADSTESGTLRWAILQANATAGGIYDLITIKTTQPIVLTSNLPLITQTVTITSANKATSIIDGNALYSAFDMRGSSLVLNLSNVTIRNTYAADWQKGSALWVVRGTANVNNVDFKNIAQGTAVTTKEGGSYINISNSLFTNNNQGVFSNYGGTPSTTTATDTQYDNRITINATTFSNNATAIYGERTVLVDNSTFISNGYAFRMQGINKHRVTNSIFNANQIAIYSNSWVPTSWTSFFANPPQGRVIHNNIFKNAVQKNIILNDYMTDSKANQQGASIQGNSWDGDGQSFVEYYQYNTTNQSNYGYVITSVNDTNTHPFAFSGNIDIAPVITAPTNVQAVVNQDGSVTVTWTPSTATNTTIDYYVISWSTTNFTSNGWGWTHTEPTVTIPSEIFASTSGLGVPVQFSIRADNNSQQIYVSSTSTAEVFVPAPAPTPTPTPTQSPTVEPTPEPTPTVIPEPEPTPTPEPEPTEPEPTPEPEPEPTDTPEPTPTPQPEPEPTTEPTDQPEESPEPEPTPEPTPTDPSEPIQPEAPIELEEEISSENIVALVEELVNIDPTELTEEQAEAIKEAALEVFATAEKGSPAYEAALDALLVAAQQDDIVLDEALAAVPLLGDVAGAAVEVFNALGNAGADMSPQVREQSEKVVIAAVIVGQVAMTATAAATSAAASAARRP